MRPLCQRAFWSELDFIVDIDMNCPVPSVASAASVWLAIRDLGAHCGCCRVSNAIAAAGPSEAVWSERRFVFDLSPLTHLPFRLIDSHTFSIDQQTLRRYLARPTIVEPSNGLENVLVRSLA